MAGKGRSRSRLRGALEITGSRLHLAVLAPGGDAVRTRSLEWRKDDLALTNQAGREALAAALTELAVQEKLRGARLRVVLNRQYCTTRVVTGAGERVRRELAQLHNRCSLYLGLGPGEKAIAECVQPLDARHEHALLAVANHRTLDAVLEAMAAAGIEATAIEPSMVALSRALGQAEDGGRPQLLLNITGEGIELGIAQAGRLLLDYRPGGGVTGDAVAEAVGKHLNRLERYCHRYASINPGASGPALAEVRLFGPPDAVERARQGFERLGRIEAQGVDPAAIEPQWRFDSPPSSEQCPVLGGCLIEAGRGPAVAAPDFLHRIQAERRQPLGPMLWRLALPAAAVLLMTVVLWGLNFWERSRCAELAAQAEALEPAKERAAVLRQECISADAKTKILRQIADGIRSQSWSDVVLAVNRSLPENVWLQRMEGGTGNVKVAGMSFGDEGIYELVRWLTSVPGFSAVQLEGMQPQRLPSGLATRFDVRFDLAGQAVSAAPVAPAAHAAKEVRGD